MDKTTYVNAKNEESSCEKPGDSFVLKLLKLCNKKNTKIFLLVAIAVVSLILYFGFVEDDKSIDTLSCTSGNYTSTMDYCKLLEDKLVNVLSSVDGAGNVSVMISLDGSPEIVYADEKDITSSSNSSGTSSTSSSTSPIIVEVNGSPNALILTEILPAVKGVIVVSSGAGNVAVKLNLLNAVSTLLDIATEQVTVLKGI